MITDLYSRLAPLMQAKNALILASPEEVLRAANMAHNRIASLASYLIMTLLQVRPRSLKLSFELIIWKAVQIWAQHREGDLWNTPHEKAKSMHADYWRCLQDKEDHVLLAWHVSCVLPSLAEVPLDTDIQLSVIAWFPESFHARNAVEQFILYSSCEICSQ